MSAESDIRALLVEHDRFWSTLDIGGLSAQWDLDDPQVSYMGDEYRDPVVGAAAVRRHWGRLGTRLRDATVTSKLLLVNELTDGLALALIDVRWAFATVEGEELRQGTSWVSAVLRRTPDGWRFVSYMERLAGIGDASA